MENFLNIKTIHLRLTTNMEMQKVTDFVSTIATVYLISQEDPGVHQHYHILLQYQDDDNKNSKLRYKIKKSLGLQGNGKYSISLVRNEKQLMKYILKDGGVFEKKNIPDEIITLMKKCSNKKGKKSFGNELSLLEEKYLGSSYNEFNEFAKNFILLKIQYGQNLYGNHIKAYLLKMKIKRDPLYINQFISNLNI